MLTNQKIVIIGGSSGIGYETAKKAIEQGAEVIIASRSASKLQKATERLGPKAEALVLNTAYEEQVKAFFENIGPFDHLVVTAAVSSGGPFLHTDNALFRFGGLQIHGRIIRAWSCQRCGICTRANPGPGAGADSGEYRFSGLYRYPVEGSYVPGSPRIALRRHCGQTSAQTRRNGGRGGAKRFVSHAERLCHGYGASCRRRTFVIITRQSENKRFRGWGSTFDIIGA